MAFKAIIVGNVGNADNNRFNHTPSGSAVLNFSMATTRRWTDKDTQEKREVTTWHRLVAWGKKAEILNQYLQTGSKLYVECEDYKVDGYTANDGDIKGSADFTVANFEFLGGGNRDGSSASNHDVDVPPVTSNTDDIPF